MVYTLSAVYEQVYDMLTRGSAAIEGMRYRLHALQTWELLPKMVCKIATLFAIESARGEGSALRRSRANTLML